MFDLQNPFFRPLWIRVTTVAVSLGWACVEILTGSPGWAAAFAVAGLYAGYEFFLNWHPKDDEEGKDDG
ncbi:MAG: hypothetical protein P8X50_17485 [Maritimibacter sp.]|jgi:hypothetical protein